MGIIRGIGKANYAAIGSIFGYYCISLPLGWVLAMNYDFNLYGLWLGMGIGATIVVTYFQVVINCMFDWERISHEAR
jgi:multidrug resistance protein, MATE family